MTNKTNFEIHYTHHLDFVIGKFVYRHCQRNAVSNYADVLKVNWFFNSAYWDS